MKKIKYICCFILLLYGFLLNGDSYVEDLIGNKLGGSYISASTSNDDVMEMLAALEQTADDAGCGLIYRYEMNVGDSYDVTLYLSARAEEMLKEIIPLKEGKYSGIFSGTCDLKIKPFSQLTELDDDFFDGIRILGDEGYNEEDVKREFMTGSLEEPVGKTKDIVNAMREQGYYCAQIDASKDFSARLPHILWLGIALMLLILTWFDIQLNKKESFILISMGKPAGQVALENIGKDTVIYTVIFIVLRFGLGTVTYAGYTLDPLPLLPLLFLVLNAILYLDILRCDYKEVMYGAHIKQSLLKACVALNMFITVLVVSMLAVVVPPLVKNIKPMLQFSQFDRLEKEGYGFLHVKNSDTAIKDSVWADDLAARICAECIQKGKLAMALNVWLVLIYDDTTKYLVGDDSLFDNLDDFCDIHVFVPETSETEESDVEMAVLQARHVFGAVDYEPTYEVIRYRQDISPLYIGHFQSENFELGYGEEKNPVFVYVSAPERMISEGVDLDQFYYRDEYLVRLTEEDIRALEDEYRDEGVVELIFTSVQDYSANYIRAIVRKVVLYGLIGIFAMVMNFLAISLILKLEYAIQGKKLALRTVFGDSIWKKEGGLLRLNVIGSLAGFGLVTLVYVLMRLEYLTGIKALFYKNEKYLFLAWLRDTVPWNLIPFVLVLALVNFIFMYMRIQKMDRTQTIKLLKGGSL